jgi:hypothetical protein
MAEHHRSTWANVFVHLLQNRIPISSHVSTPWPGHPKRRGISLNSTQNFQSSKTDETSPNAPRRRYHHHSEGRYTPFLGLRCLTARKGPVAQPSLLLRSD